MLPSTIRGREALFRLKVFEGIPPPFDKRKRKVVPAALRVLRLKQNRRVYNYLVDNEIFHIMPSLFG